jgi:hypothetical protein
MSFRPKTKSIPVSETLSPATYVDQSGALAFSSDVLMTMSIPNDQNIPTVTLNAPQSVSECTQSLQRMRIENGAHPYVLSLQNLSRVTAVATKTVLNRSYDEPVLKTRAKNTPVEYCSCDASTAVEYCSCDEPVFKRASLSRAKNTAVPAAVEYCSCDASTAVEYCSCDEPVFKKASLSRAKNTAVEYRN